MASSGLSTNIVQGLQILGPIVSWALVIGGWHIVRRDNKAREDRRDIRSSLDEIIRLINSLEASTCAYYRTSPSTPDVELTMVSIIRDTEELEAKIDRLYEFSGKFIDRSKHVKQYQDVLTGGDFEQKSRIERQATDRKMLEIALHAKNLVSYLEAEYRNIVKKS